VRGKRSGLCYFAFFLIITGLLLTSVTAFAQHIHYIAGNGSDSNNGTSETTPWLHAPGMTGCTSNCASYSPAAGDQIILRGGDTWHFSGGGSPVGLPWTWTASGASGSHIYVGVDKTWFTGGSWNRPILTGDNALSINPVGSCANTNSGFFTQSGSYVDFDNVEFTGMCSSGSDGHGALSCSSNCDDPQVTMNQGTHDSVFENLYFHGWTHVRFSCSYTTQLNGNCDVMTSILNDSHSTGDMNNQYVGIVVDGSDSDPLSGGCMVYGGYDVHNSVCRYASQGFVTNNTRYFHDNLIEYINESSDGVRHSNGWEMNGSNTALDWYNNVVRHNGTISSLGVNLWFNPGGDLHSYNNLVYDVHAGANYWDIAGVGGTYYIYNNTLQDPTIANNTYQPIILSTNNHFIGATGFSGVFLSSSRVTDTKSVYQTDAQANAQGYTAANQYAPTSSGGATVGAGANLTSSCGSNFAQLCSDTTLACSYDSTNHVVSCPARTPNPRSSSGAWDAGAYLFMGDDPPAPPTNLTAAPY
jgi:hypothetical protein